ncbi:hypothetical protein DV737_g263, partial [Chaetothyriales sp. CBS 132003]
MSTASSNSVPVASANIATGTGTSRTTSPQNPLITILGATGTGKSALAVSLARRFNGEIINADAMQMYRGLPIITNKIRADEQDGVPHHMLDFIGLEEPPWTVKREWYKEQQEAAKEKMMDANGGDGQEGLLGLQYDTLLLWLEAEDAVLKERLNARVDAMVRTGLLEEVMELQQEEQWFRRMNVTVDKTKGIWQSIGYKELELWATKVSLNADDHDAVHLNASTTNSKLAADGIEGVKAGTRQYAKRQNRYIRNRFASALRQAGALDKLFLIDSTDISRWGETAVPQSEKLVLAFLEGRQLPDAAMLSDLASATFARITKQDDWRSTRVAHYCETCEKTLMGDKEWERHITSRSHKNVIQSQRKKAARDAFLAKRAALVGTEEAESRPP